MATYCPTCRGLMRPHKGTLACIACAQRGRARTVLAGGRRISVAAGQQGLGSAPAPAVAHEPPLAPQPPSWKRKSGGRPHERLGLFPHDEARDGQVRFMRDAKMALEAGRHLVAHAPTGIGKTAASLAPALEAALATDRTVLFLTNRQSQHRIAVETLRRIQENRGVPFTLVDLVAKRDMCLRPEAAEMHPGRFPDFCARETRTRACQFVRDPDADTLQKVAQGVLHVEELMAVSKASAICPHMVAMAAARNADVVVADYNHLFSDIREASLERLGVQLSDIILVVDEAHNLADRIRGGHSHRVTPFLLDLVESEARSQGMGAVQADLNALRQTLRSLAEAAQSDGRARPARIAGGEAQVATLEVQALHEAYEAQRNRLSLGTSRTLQNTLEDLGKLVKAIRKDGDGQVHAEELREALEDWGRFGDGALRYVQWEGGSAQLHIRLLDPAIPARPVFAGVHSAILMSGTLQPPAMARDLLGLEAARTTVRAYVSPFPQENRFTCVPTDVSTRYDDRSPALWARLGALVAQLASAARGNIAVFTPSYAILRELRAALPETGRPLIVEEPEWTKRDRDQVLDQLEGARRSIPAILLGVLGGSMAEGVDFKDNLLSAVVVAGLPLAPPDLEVEATIAYFERLHPGQGRNYGYVVPAMNRVLQAVGRGIRSGTDKCAVVLWDRRYLAPPYRGLIPQEMPLVATQDPGTAAAAFVRANGL